MDVWRTRSRTSTHRVGRSAATLALGLVLALGLIGCTPATTLSSNTAAFGPVTIATSATPITLAVTLDQALPTSAQFLQSRLTDPDGAFTVDSFTCPTDQVTVPAGQILGTVVCQVVIGFRPATAGEHVGSVVIGFPWADLATVALSGTGTEGPTAALAESSFPIALPGAAILAVVAGIWLERRRRVGSGSR